MGLHYVLESLQKEMQPYLSTKTISVYFESLKELVSFNITIEELKTNVKVVDNVFSEKHGKSFI